MRSRRPSAARRWSRPTCRSTTSACGSSPGEPHDSGPLGRVSVFLGLTISTMIGRKSLSVRVPGTVGHPGAALRKPVEVMAFVEVLDEARLDGMPSQQLLCLGARGREVLRKQDPDETEVLGRLLR